MKAEAECWAVTPRGVELARVIASQIGAEVRAPERFALPHERPFSRLADAVAESWPEVRAHVFVAAAGIVVRTIAPLLAGKTRDPAVVICDQNGRYAVSLLSGHMGQANALARRVAEITGGQAVITTATDCEGLPAFDELAVLADCAIGSMEEAKAVSAALLIGRRVKVEDPHGVLASVMPEAFSGCSVRGSGNALVIVPHGQPVGPNVPETSAQTPAGAARSGHTSAAVMPEVWVGLMAGREKEGRLCLYPRLVWAGVGCRRGVSAGAIIHAVQNACAGAGLSPLSLAGLASADIKRDEPGLAAAAETLGVPLRFIDAESLRKVPVPHPSAPAAKLLEVDSVGVCEASALLASGFSREPGPGYDLGRALVYPKHTFDAKGHLLDQDGKKKGVITVALAVSGGSAAIGETL